MLYPPVSNVLNIFGFSIHYYGVIIAFAISLAVLLLNFLCKKSVKNLNFDILLDILPSLLIISIVCARLYYVVLNFAYYKNHILEIFMIWQGGLSIHGGIIGGIITLFVWLKYKQISFFKYADVITIALPLAQSIGRWGNYFNQEAFGLPCNYKWCMFIETANRPLQYFNYNYFHPTFLYELILDFLIFLILLFIFLKFKNLKSGIIFFLYLILYSIARICVETIRVDANIFLFGVPIPVVVSAVIIFISVISLISIHKNSQY